MKLTIPEAQQRGFIVDHCTYPPVAYKGPRFQPKELRRCFTALETELMNALEIAFEVLPPSGARNLIRETLDKAAKS